MEVSKAFKNQTIGNVQNSIIHIGIQKVETQLLQTVTEQHFKINLIFLYQFIDFRVVLFDRITKENQKVGNIDIQFESLVNLGRIILNSNY